MANGELAVLYGDELLSIASDSISYFQGAIEKKGLVFSEQLKNDFEVFMINNSTVVAAEIHFSIYGRYKDMKITKHENAPPIAAIQEFVEQTGVSKFAWIPGYEYSDKVPVESIAVKRLAWAIARSFVGVPKKKKFSGTWYNETKMKMVNVARRRIMDITAKYTASIVADGLHSTMD